MSITRVESSGLTPGEKDFLGPPRTLPSLDGGGRFGRYTNPHIREYSSLRWLKGMIFPLAAASAICLGLRIPEPKVISPVQISPVITTSTNIASSEKTIPVDQLLKDRIKKFLPESRYQNAPEALPKLILQNAKIRLDVTPSEGSRTYTELVNYVQSRDLDNYLTEHDLRIMTGFFEAGIPIMDVAKDQGRRFISSRNISKLNPDKEFDQILGYMLWNKSLGNEDAAVYLLRLYAGSGTVLRIEETLRREGRKNISIYDYLEQLDPVQRAKVKEFIVSTLVVASTVEKID